MKTNPSSTAWHLPAQGKKRSMTCLWTLSDLPACQPLGGARTPNVRQNPSMICYRWWAKCVCVCVFASLIAGIRGQWLRWENASSAKIGGLLPSILTLTYCFYRQSVFLVAQGLTGSILLFTASFFVPTLLYLKSKNGKLCTDTPLFCRPAVLRPCPSLILLCQCSICLLAVTNSSSCGCQDLTLPTVRVLICSVFLGVMK